MSHPSIKWIPGAPKQLKVGMVLKSGNRVELMGTESHNFRVEGVTFTMLDGSPIEAHGQLVEDYVLEWLGNDGIVKGESERSKPDWEDAPYWAMWLAQDENGDWAWWESKPTYEEDERPYWMPSKEACENLVGRFKPAKSCQENKSWRDTLEARP